MAKTAGGTRSGSSRNPRGIGGGNSISKEALVRSINGGSVVSDAFYSNAIDSIETERGFRVSQLASGGLEISRNYRTIATVGPDGEITYSDRANADDKNHVAQGLEKASKATVSEIRQSQKAERQRVQQNVSESKSWKVSNSGTQANLKGANLGNIRVNDATSYLQGKSKESNAIYSMSINSNYGRYNEYTIQKSIAKGVIRPIATIHQDGTVYWVGANTSEQRTIIDMLRRYHK